MLPQIIRISSVQSLSHVQLFATPWTAALQASLSITNSWSLLFIISIESVMPSNHLILCFTLLLLSSIFPSIRVFSNEPVLLIKWPKNSYQNSYHQRVYKKQMLVRMQRKGHPSTLLVGLQLVSATPENSMKLLKTLKLKLPYTSAISLLDMWPNKAKTLIQKDTQAPVFIEVYTIVKIWKEIKCPSTT